MIGCLNITDTIECLQYVNDVTNTKYLYIGVILLLSLLLIYYSKTKHYKITTKKFYTYRIMLMLPLAMSYLSLSTIVFMPLLLSINVGIDAFMKYVYVLIFPSIIWCVLMIFLMLLDWGFQRVGFKNTWNFYRALRNKK